MRIQVEHAPFLVTMVFLLYILIIAIDEGGIEWRSKDGGLSGGTRQKPLQVTVVKKTRRMKLTVFCFSFRQYTLALNTTITKTRWK